MTDIESVKEHIKQLHEIYYRGKFLDDGHEFMKMHHCFEVLFNFAEIENTLVDSQEKIEGMITPREFYEGLKK